MTDIDENVLRKAALGDMRSFEQVVTGSQNYVWNYAIKFLGDYHLAEDAAQEIFIKVYKGLPKFNQNAMFSTWLYRITHNHCVDVYRKNNKNREIQMTEEIATEQNVQITDDYLADILNRLKPELRQVFGTVAIFGFSYREASEALGLSVETIKSRLYQARQELIKMLKEEAEAVTK